MLWTEEEIRETSNLVKERAATDAAFRALCLSDIRAAVREVSGKELPQGIKVKVVDGHDYHYSLVLPPMKSHGDELSEAELEAVAGGTEDEGKHAGLPSPW